MPFHPKRLKDVLGGFGNDVLQDASESELEAKPLRGVFRSKGQVWPANANAYPMVLHTAGKVMNLTPHGMPFLHAIPEAEWIPQCYEWRQQFIDTGRWTEANGDRHSRLVLIGVNLNQELILRKLNESLLTEEESRDLGGTEGWRNLEDPFFGKERFRIISLNSMSPLRPSTRKRRAEGSCERRRMRGCWKRSGGTVRNAELSANVTEFCKPNMTKRAIPPST